MASFILEKSVRRTRLDRVCLQLFLRSKDSTRHSLHGLTPILGVVAWLILKRCCVSYMALTEEEGDAAARVSTAADPKYPAKV